MIFSAINVVDKFDSLFVLNLISQPPFSDLACYLSPSSKWLAWLLHAPLTFQSVRSCMGSSTVFLLSFQNVSCISVLMVSGSLIKLPWSTKQYVTCIHFRNHAAANHIIEINAANGKMNQTTMVELLPR